MSIQKPFNISVRGQTIDANEVSTIGWQVSGAIQNKYSLYISFNNFNDIKLTAHGLNSDSLIVNTTRDSTINGIRIINLINTNFIHVAEIANMSVGDSVDKFNMDSTVSSTASSTSTDTVIEVANTGLIVAGDIVLVDGEYRFVSSVSPNVSITVSQAFSTSTANKSVTAWHKSGTQVIEHAFKAENVVTFSTSHNLISGSLLNGREYKITIIAFDENDNSATSNPEIFQTSSRPIVTVDPIGTVTSFNYNFTAQYSQAENVSLRNYIVHLYNSNQNRIASSNIKTSLPLEHLFANLQSDIEYYIEFQATSSRGLIGTSGLVLFNVSYLRPNMNVNLQAKNIDNAGIELSWFVKQIIGETDGSTFIDNEKIDTTDGTKVWFDEGFSIERDFSLKMWLENPLSRRDLIILNGENGQIRLQYSKLDECFHLYKRDLNEFTTEWISSPVSGNDFVVLIQQINKNMNILAEIYA